MEPQGLYLNKWTLDFDPSQGTPSAIPVWVSLPYLPRHCWNSESMETIGNKLEKYIDRVERREQYFCARICVEVNLETRLPEAIKLTIVERSHI